MATAPLAIGGYGPTLLAVLWVEFFVAFALLLARIYTTWRITRRVRLDLYLTLLTFAIATASAVFLTLSISYGLGQHIENLTEEGIVATIKWSWVNQVLAIFAIGLGKLAIVAFLQQIHGPEGRGKIIALWALAASNFVINAITVGMVLSQCTPLQKLWDESLPGTCDGRRRNQNCAYFQGTQTQREGWSVLPDGARCHCLRLLHHQDDGASGAFTNAGCHLTEMWVILIVGCIPPIRPLFIALFRKVVSSARSLSGPEKYNRSGTELRYFSHASRHSRQPVQSQRSRGTELGSMANDHESEENILAMEGGAIVKTTNISLTYEGSTTASREPVDQGI
ncbi:hypothetical protein T310_3772 [Rasamsonia emersonii CBS 393.64]|uniref:Rhodopsin domain-containing protein n=1 Tax=Rasamsonia emersonii (strain ATCC 16479 / CBS 393.64 / IMI 116815) TaxID=1408163 RepID=A0A0F4YX69_RASE3|nr:hypothetical protein T310_3772 [Rasamsonia emersonii CBS 393.64]KKA22208.1 hypothetical protein T310_3772 [Rasamsonia emersonii CBS 393.64]